MEKGTQSLSFARADLLALHRSLTRPLDRKVLAALLSPLLVVVVAALAFLGVVRSQEGQNWVTHSREVIDLLQRIELSLVDAETEERGYLLTHGPGYLESYQAAAQRGRALLDRLGALVSDNPTQAAQAKELRQEWETKLAQLATTVDLFERAGIEGARTYILTGTGARQMQAARSTVEKMIDAER